MLPRAALVAFVLGVASTPAAHADIGSWLGLGVNDDWSNPFNWFGTSSPPSDLGATLIRFESLSFSGGNTPSSDVDADWSVKGFEFSDSSFRQQANEIYSSNGSVLTIGAGGIFNGSTVTQTFDVALVLGAAQTWNAATGDILVNSTRSGASALTIQGGSASRKVTFAGNGSAQTGAISVASGTLLLGNVDAISASSTVTVAAGATLDLGDTAEDMGGLAGAGAVKIGHGALGVGFNNLETEFSGALSGDGLFTKNGTSRTILSGNGSGFTGNVVVAAGTLEVGVNDTLSNLTTVIVGNGATLRIAGNGEDFGALSGEAGSALELAQNLGTGYTGDDATFAGSVSGAGNFVKHGLGKLVLSGNNTSTGVFDVQQGTLEAGVNDSLSDANAVIVRTGAKLRIAGDGEGFGSLAGETGSTLELTQLTGVGFKAGDTTFAGDITGAGGFAKFGSSTMKLTGNNTWTGAIVVQGGTLEVGENDSLSDANAVTVLTGAKLRIAGNGENFGSLAGEAGSSLELAQSVGVGFNGADTTFAGDIGGTGAFVKHGAGTMTLSGNNAIGGSVTVNGGALQVTAGNTAFDSGHIAAGATFRVEAGVVDVAGHITNAGTLAIAGTGILNGVVEAGGLSRALTTSGVFDMQDGSQLNLPGGAGDISIFGGDGGSGGLFDLTGGTAAFHGTAALSLAGGKGDSGDSGGNGGYGGVFTVGFGTSATLSENAIVSLAGGAGGGGLDGGNGGNGGVILQSGGTLVVSGNALVNLAGGNSGHGAYTSGASGAGGSFFLDGGAASLLGSAVLDLSGGLGSGDFSAGDGGRFQQGGGSFTLDGGTIRLTGGTGGVGPAGLAGSVALSNGSFDFRKGLITGDPSIAPLEPAALVAATMKLSGGILKLGSDFANQGGALELSASAVIDGATVEGGNGLSFRTAGSLDVRGTSRINLLGGNSVLATGLVYHVGSGGSLIVEDGTASFSEDAVVNLNGGAGGAGAVSGGTGGAGGRFSVTGGAVSISGNAIVNLLGNSGGSFLTGGPGGVGGTFAVTGGTATLAQSAVLDLSGGSSGSGLLGGGSGGAGGTVLVSDGRFDMTGGTIRLAGGQGASATFGGASPSGQAGSFEVSGGTFDFAGGLITGDSAVAPEPSAEFADTTLSISGGAVNILGDLVIDHATLQRSGGVLDFVADHQTLVARNGASVDIGGTYDDGAFELDHDNTFNVQSGASLSYSQWLDIGNDTDGTLILSGPGSSLTTHDLSYWGYGAGRATVVVNGGAVAHVAGLQLLGDVTVSGPDSLLAVTDDRLLEIGTSAPEGAAALLRVEDSGRVDAGAGYTVIRHTGTIEIDHGTFKTASGIDVDGGQLRLLGGTLDASAINLLPGGTFEFTGGTLHVDTFDGTLDNLGGTLSPGHSPGLTTIYGDYHQGPTGSLHIEIAGPGDGDFDRVTASGALSLGGTLEVELLDGFAPVVGDSFTILLATAITGHFDVLNLPQLNGLVFKLDIGADSATLRVAAVPLPGGWLLLISALAPLVRSRRRARGAAI